MKIERKFTTADKGAYASLDFITTVSEIRNPDGTIVFHLDDLKSPTVGAKWQATLSRRNISAKLAFRRA